MMSLILSITAIIFTLFPYLLKFIRKCVDWFFKNIEKKEQKGKFIFYSTYNKEKLIEEISTTYSSIERINEISKENINDLIGILKKDTLSNEEKYAIKRFSYCLNSINQYSHLSSTLSLYITFVGGFSLTLIVNWLLRGELLKYLSIIIPIIIVFVVVFFLVCVVSVNKGIENDRRRLFFLKDLISLYIKEFMESK